MTTTEPTVEECLKELREMFPRYHVRVGVEGYAWHNPAINESRCDHQAAVSVGQVEHFSAPTLSEAMAQVRKWHAEQAQPKPTLPSGVRHRGKL